MPGIAHDGYETAHADNIMKLVKEFGQYGREEIEELYGRVRMNLEKGAKVMEFLPLLVYKQARDALLRMGNAPTGSSIDHIVQS